MAPFFLCFAFSTGQTHRVVPAMLWYDLKRAALFARMAFERQIAMGGPATLFPISIYS